MSAPSTKVFALYDIDAIQPFHLAAISRAVFTPAMGQWAGKY
jgi:hypothetical protein